jgi:hypothetical protein
VTYSVSRVNTSTDTWQVVIDRLNTVANVVSNAAVTVDGTTGGAASVGNGFITGIFGANTLVTGALRGGNVSVAAILPITSNVQVGNATVYTYITNTSVNSAVISTGSGVYMNTTGLAVGNVVANTTMLTVGGSNVITTSTRMAVAQNTTSTYQRSRVNYVAGNNVTLAITDESGNNQITIAISAQVPSLNLGGSTGQVQYNGGGTLAASAGLSFNASANNLTVANTLFAATLVLDGAGYVDQINLTANGSSAVLVDSWSLGTYRQAKYTISVSNKTSNGYMGVELLLMHDGSDSHLLEYAAINSNGAFGTWSANVGGGAVNLYFTPGSVNTAVRMFRHLLIV